jgi:hypothetical protein
MSKFLDISNSRRQSEGLVIFPSACFYLVLVLIPVVQLPNNHPSLSQDINRSILLNSSLIAQIHAQLSVSPFGRLLCLGVFLVCGSAPHLSEFQPKFDIWEAKSLFSSTLLRESRSSHHDEYGVVVWGYGNSLHEFSYDPSVLNQLDTKLGRIIRWNVHISDHSWINFKVPPCV